MIVLEGVSDADIFTFSQNLRGLGDNWTQRFGLHPHQGMVSGCFRYLKPYLNKPFEFHKACDDFVVESLKSRLKSDQKVLLLYI